MKQPWPTSFSVVVAVVVAVIVVVVVKTNNAFHLMITFAKRLGVWVTLVL